MIELWGMSSPNVAKVMIALEELGLAYRFRTVDVFRGGQYNPEFLKISPNNKVPAIVDHDGPGGEPLSVFESGAILIYLAEKTGRLLSVEPAARSRELQWLMMQVSTVGPMLGQWNHFNRMAPPGQNYGLQRYSTERRRILDVLARRLDQSRFLGGPEYSIADIATFPWIRNTLRYAFPDVDPASALADDPSLHRWYSEIKARPAVSGLDASEAKLREADSRARATASDDEIDRFVGRGRYARA